MKLTNLFLILFLFLLFLFFTGCEKEKEDDAPSACFTYEPETITAGSEVTYNSSCSKNAVGYLWDFGDGSTSTEANPIHAFLNTGTYTVSLTVTNNGDSDATSESLTAGAPSVFIHSEDIDSDETWIEANHLINNDIHINNATVTILPGAHIEFSSSSSLSVGYGSGNNAALIANGTVEKQIILTSESSSPKAGDWDYIYFGEGATSNCSLTNCEIAYGGNQGSDGVIIIDGCNITIENCGIKYSNSNGISLENDGYFKSFRSNTFLDIAQFNIVIEANYVHTIGEDNHGTLNGIKIIGGSYNRKDETWLSHFRCPYYLYGDLDIGAETGSILRLQAGTVLHIGDNSGIYVGYYNDFGTLIAEGTEPTGQEYRESIIVKSASANPGPGDWECIWFGEGTSSATSLKYCQIHNGGGLSGYGMINLENCNIKIENCIFSKCPEDAISLDDQSYFGLFQNNSFISCDGYPIRIYGNFVHTIGEGNDFSGQNGIFVEYDDYVQDNETWLNHGCPYIIDGDLDIGNPTGSILTIEPGTVLEFTQESSIWIGFYAGTFGKLVADGSSETIKFTSAAPEGSKTAGDWDYIYFASGTMGGSTINHCILEYGGGNEGYGMINCEDTNAPVITNNTIRHSQYHGISLDNSTPSISDNTYESIGGSNIFIE
ncbi:MAG: PKD domain-containing protein [Bacteroidales bacterium]|nr:PKD domain-containing protein [Bacteroidales bacterium]